MDTALHDSGTNYVSVRTVTIDNGSRPRNNKPGIAVIPYNCQTLLSVNDTIIA